MTNVATPPIMVGKMRQHPIRDNTIATVLGGVLLAFLAVERLRGIALRWGSWLLGTLGQLKDYLGQPVSLTRWVVFLGAFFLCAFFLLLLLAFRASFRRVAPASHPYTSDTFFGILWRWGAEPGVGTLSVRSFCPQCDMELYPNYNSYGESLQFHCENCGFAHNVEHMDGPQLENVVIRAIQRKIRTGEWKRNETVASQ